MRCYAVTGPWPSPVIRIAIAIFVVATTAAPRIAFAAESFAPRLDLGSGAATAVAIADVNRDGKLDLIVGSDSVDVLLGNGDGTFGPPIGSSGRGVVAVGLADFDRDGKPDIVISNVGDNTVEFMPGRGDGSFGPEQLVYAGADPHDLSFDVPYTFGVGDVNRDGKLDLVIGPCHESTVSVYLGDGNGAFGAPTGYLVGGKIWGVQLADFNGDGRPDVAIANSWAALSVMLGNGDPNGTFSPYSRFDTVHASWAIAVGDLNRDGIPDVVSVSFDGKTGVLLGRGDGTFDAPIEYATGAATSLGLVDLDGDGNLDLISTDDEGPVTVRHGSTGGAFGAGHDYAVDSASWGGPNPRSVVVGDLNGDGRPDFVVANASGPHQVSVFLNTTTNVGVTSPSKLPTRLQMKEPEPNPSSGACTVHFALPTARVVTLDIFDASGRMVKTLISAEDLPAGEHAILWNGRDAQGQGVPAGLYLTRLRAGAEIATGKLLRLR